MAYKKHFLLICGLSLLMLSSIPLVSIHARHHINYQQYRVARRVRKSKHSHHKFKYTKYTLQSLHYLLLKHYHINFDYDSTIRLAHLFLRSHNYTYHQIKARLNQQSKHYFIRLTKRYRYHTNYHLYYRKPVKRINHHQQDLIYQEKMRRASWQGSAFNTTLRTQLIEDINKTRIRFHKKPLKVTLLAQQTANYRDNKVQYAYEHPFQLFKYEHISLANFHAHGDMTDGWAHGVDTHTSGLDYLRHHYEHYNNMYWGANCGNWMTGKYVAQPDGTLDKHSDENPYGIAKNIDEMNIYHDNTDENNNNHRKNELSSHYRYLGVGVTYNPKINLGSFNEQFIG